MSPDVGDLGAFLRSRRNRLLPEHSPYPHGTRRVPGLRRQEVAASAGVSVDYYIRLEQGREPHPSPQVVDALSRALRLGDDERTFLHRLAGHHATVRRDDTPPSAELPSPLVDMVQSWQMPAFIVDPLLNIVVTSAATGEMFRGFTHTGNFAEMLFLDARARTFFAGWDGCARWAVGTMRLLSTYYPSSADREAFIASLRTGSADFSAMWDGFDIAVSAGHTAVLHHDVRGPMTVDALGFEVPSHPGYRLVICHIRTEAPDAAAVAHPAATEVADLTR